jgi:hypothetical protein
MPTTAVAAVEKLYNPFRDERKAKEEMARKRSIDPFAGLSFVHEPPLEFDAFPKENKSQGATFREQKIKGQHVEFDPFSFRPSSSSKPAKENAPRNKPLVETSGKPALAALAPKMVVKLTSHEEVTSRVKMALDELDVTTEVSVEGTVYVSIRLKDVVAIHLV